MNVNKKTSILISISYASILNLTVEKNEAERITVMFINWILSDSIDNTALSSGLISSGNW